MNKQEDMHKALEFLNNEGGAPDYMIMDRKTYWFFKYTLGLARFKPRIKGVKRKR